MDEGEGSVRYTYNIFSETMGAYLLATDSDEPDLTIDVPDGNLRLELYQQSTAAAPYARISNDWLAAYAGVAKETMPEEHRRFDWQYGDAAEALASTAVTGRLIHSYCEQQAVNGCGVTGYDTEAVADALLGSYGLAGQVTLLSAEGMKTVVSFPFCSFLSGPDMTSAFVDPALCARKRKHCYNGTRLADQFRCASSYAFSVWAFGPPRNVTVKPMLTTPVRSLTPFNRAIGGIIMTQTVRHKAACPSANTPAVRVLTGRFGCQVVAVADTAFGVDPAHLRSASLYNGKVSASDFYAPCEMLAGTRKPFAFFPHQWGNGAPKDPALVVAGSAGAYKLYLDIRLRPDRARALGRTIREGSFITSQTEKVEAMMVTYNADFNLFGILLVQFRWTLGGSIQWEYQYNTALLSPYEGVRGRMSLGLDAIVGLMLLADILRALRDARRAALRASLTSGYVAKVWNWVEWTHFGLLSAGFVVWAEYNQYVTATVLRAEYPVLLDLEAPARVFATDPQGEKDLLSFAGTLRQVSELKNLWTALSCTNVLLFVARFLRMLDFQPRMSLITRTLHTASTDLGHYLTLFAIILAGYATVGTLLLGDRVGQFQNFKDSSAALFWILMGWEPKMMYTALFAATGKSNTLTTKAVFQIFFWSWVLIATFLMLNILLAIIIDSFARVKRGLRGVPTITTEAVSVSLQAAKLACNRLLGKEWLISDREFEKVLRAHERSMRRHLFCSVRMKHIQGIGLSKCIRVPGGFRVSGQDLENILQDSRSNHRQTLLMQTKVVRAAARTVFGLTKLGKLDNSKEDGLDIAEDQECLPPLQIRDILNRYGEVLTDGQDDEERLEILQTENLQREIAMATSLHKVQARLDAILKYLDVLGGHVLPITAQQQVRDAQARKLVQKRQNEAQIQLSTRSFRGVVKFTIICAKYLPKLDFFSESEPYCMVVMDNVKRSCSEPSLLATTEVVRNNQNPLWNAEYVLPLACEPDAIFIIAVLDRDDHGNDSLIGAARISVQGLPVGQEVDRWYRLRNDSAPEISNKGLVRIKIEMKLATGQAETEDDGVESESTSTDQGLCTHVEPSSEGSNAAGVWLEERLFGVNDAPGASMSTNIPILEMTVVSAKYLPSRGIMHSRTSLCNPYALVLVNGASFQSLICKNTLFPEWGHVIALNLAGIGQEGDGVSVSILDWNRAASHKFIGAIRISIEQLWKYFVDVSCSPNQQICLSLFLQKRYQDVVNGNGHRAELIITFRLAEH